MARALARRRPLISLTPLIDVVFILLVFFMLASSFLDWRSIDLSAPGAASTGSAMEGAMLVEVRPSGLRLSGHPATLDEISARLEARIAETPGLRVVVRPARGVPLQDTVAVLDRISGAGITDVSLVRKSGQ